VRVEPSDSRCRYSFSCDPAQQSVVELHREDQRVGLPAAVRQRVHLECLAVQELAEHFATAARIVAETDVDVDVDVEGSDLVWVGRWTSSAGAL
jgi:hypothetical protein